MHFPGWTRNVTLRARLKSIREPVKAATATLVCHGDGLRIYESADRRGNKGNALGTFAHFIFLVDLTEGPAPGARTFAPVRVTVKLNCGSPGVGAGERAGGVGWSEGNLPSEVYGGWMVTMPGRIRISGSPLTGGGRALRSAERRIDATRGGRAGNVRRRWKINRQSGWKFNRRLIPRRVIYLARVI